MANGKAHEKINLFFLAVGIAAVMTLINKSWFFEGVFVIMGYIIGTYLMNPDLDLRSRPYRRWGIFRFIWLPYQTFKHRSVWTHGYIISDIIRYAYLSIWYIIFVCILSYFLDQSQNNILGSSRVFLSEYKTFVFSIIFGNILSSTAHTLTDKTTSSIKKFF